MKFQAYSYDLMAKGIDFFLKRRKKFKCFYWKRGKVFKAVVEVWPPLFIGGGGDSEEADSWLVWMSSQ